MIQHIIPPSNITLEQVPGEPFLLQCLQKQLEFSVNNRIVKKGRLLLFRRVHYFIQIALCTDKNDRENFDIPIPYKVENYIDDGLMYFDYRLRSLNVKNLPVHQSKISSVYFNKILEIQVC